MNPVAAIDNDVLIKCSCYRLLERLLDLYDRRVGVLGTARFVVTQRLSRRMDLHDQSAAVLHWESLLPVMIALEPTDDELNLATSMEDTAQSMGLEFDGGESQLVAIALLRPIDAVVTGDKRAIRALENLLGSFPTLSSLAGRVICMEQLALLLADVMGLSALRRAICAEPTADKTLTICSECASSTEPDSLPGLLSYITHLRSEAPTLLVTGSVGY